jgi:hypothetical protein
MIALVAIHAGVAAIVIIVVSVIMLSASYPESGVPRLEQVRAWRRVLVLAPVWPIALICLFVRHCVLAFREACPHAEKPGTRQEKGPYR